MKNVGRSRRRVLGERRLGFNDFIIAKQCNRVSSIKTTVNILQSLYFVGVAY